MSGVRQPSGPGAPVPPFLYGTAWKEEETERLTTLALHAGFRGIDTANQRRHYVEAAVGAAARTAVDAMHSAAVVAKILFMSHSPLWVAVFFADAT